MMAKSRDFTRVSKRAQARKATRDQVTWGLHQRDKAAASLGSPRLPSKAELRRQAIAAWEEVQRRDLNHHSNAVD
jgi:hypothetical protein